MRDAVVRHVKELLETSGERTFEIIQPPTADRRRRGEFVATPRTSVCGVEIFRMPVSAA
jgi:hypothetical protein